LDECKKQIQSYNYSTIQVRKAPLDIATEIFTRINVGGKPLTLFEIMVAKTFDSKQNFDLSEKFSELIENLKPINYETISDQTVLQTISLLLDNECKRQTILKLGKKDFINTWPAAIDAIERAIEYFRSFYRIPVSQLLPYNALIVPFAYFFYYHPDKPTARNKNISKISSGGVRFRGDILPGLRVNWPRILNELIKLLKANCRLMTGA
jgi:hypothetical protein